LVHPANEHSAPSLRHSFADAERWTKVFDDPARDAWQKPDEVVAKMEILPGMTAADLGAGTGYFLGRLSAAVGADGHVLGLDVEDNMVEFMTDRAAKQGWTNVEARKVPYDTPGLDAAAVDRILIVDTWHHIEDRGAYSAKLLQALRAGGSVFVVDFTKESPHGPPPEHRLTAEQVSGELREGGFDVEVIEEDLPDQYIVVGRRPN